MPRKGEYADLTGKKYGMLTVLSFSCREKKDNKWLGRCECGKEKEIWARAFKSGSTISCGCHRKKILSHKTHGLSNTKLYACWHSMIERCFNPNSKAYRNYGGRGISVCDEWTGKDGFMSFYLWSISNGYSVGLSIDRIDNDKEYSPNNCRWATRTEQQNNKRTNKRITYNGETHTYAEWERILGLRRGLIKTRMSKGNLTPEEALTKPVLMRGRRKSKYLQQEQDLPGTLTS